MDSDCVPTALFEVADLVTLMTDQASREEAMQSYTMASARDCPPAVLLMTESRAELNAGLVVVTGHVPVISPDVSMEPETNTDPAKDTPTAGADDSDSRAHKARRIAAPATSKSPSEWETELCRSRARLLATSAVPEDPSDALLGGLRITPLLGCKARTPLEWTHAWAMLGEWAGQVAFPIPAPHIGWPRHGHGRYLRPAFIGRTPPFLTWARPIFEQGALSPMSTFPADFPILCLPGDKLFQSKEVDSNHSLPPIVHAYQGNKVNLGRKLQEWQEKGLAPLGAALLGVEQMPPLWTHSNGCDFVRGGRFVVKPRVTATRALTPTQVLLLQSLWLPVQTPHQFNTQPPWTPDCVAVSTLCGQHASLQLPADVAQPLRDSSQRRLQLELNSSELSINEIISRHADPKYRDGQTVIIESTHWQINPTDTGDLIAQCTGLGGSELDEEWDVLLACKKDAHVYGPSLSKQDDWHTKKGTIAGTAHTQRIPHAPSRPLPSWSACMVPCEGRPIAPASSSADHTQGLRGIAIRSNHPSTSQTAMDRIQAEPTPLHSAACSTPLNRNLPTTKSHYSRSQSAGRTAWSRPIDPRPQCRVVCRHGVGRNPSRIPQLHRHNCARSRGFPP